MYWAIAKRYQSIAGWRSTCVTSLVLTVYCTFVAMAQPPDPSPAPSADAASKSDQRASDTTPIQLPLAKRAVAKEPNGEFSPRAKRPINNPDAADTRTDVPPAKTNPIPMALRDIAKQPQNPGGKKKKAAVVIEEKVEEVIIGNAVPAARLMPAMAARRAMQPDNWRKEMERLLNGQLLFLQHAVTLSEEQQTAVRKFNLEWAMANVKLRSAKSVNGLVVGDGMSVSRRSRVTQLENVLEKELTAILDSEQLKTYLRERDARRQFQRDASVDGIMILLNDHLYLREDQYQSIRESLLKSYRGDHLLENYLIGDRIIPPIPDSSVVKFLDDAQKAVYQSLHKMELGGTQSGDDF